MKVIKNGRTAVEQKCPICECEFIYTHIDIVHKDTIDGKKYVVTCPECGNDISAPWVRM